MSEELIILSVGIKRIEGTENDYEQILRLAQAFEILPTESLKQIEDAVSKLVVDVKAILRARKDDEN